MKYIRKHRRGIAGGIAFVMFFLMLGAVGDMELGKVSMLESVVRIGIRLVLFVMFVYLAGGFEDKRGRRERYGSSRIHSGRQRECGNKGAAQGVDRIVGQEDTQGDRACEAARRDNPERPRRGRVLQVGECAVVETAVQAE